MEACSLWLLGLGFAGGVRGVLGADGEVWSCLLWVALRVGILYIVLWRFGVLVSVLKVECGIEEVFGLVKARLQDCGLLLTSVGSDGKANVMTIGWGLTGRMWGQTVFMVAVRPSRFTYGLVEETGEFTVNVPPERDLDDAVAYCGKVSGRDRDKLGESGFEVEKGKTVGSPIVSRCVAHLECRVIGKSRLAPELLSEDVMKSYASGNFHTLYFGKPLRILMEK